MLRELLSGSGGIDASKLASAAGLPNDPASLAAIFSQLQQAMQRSEEEGIDWSLALRQAEQRASAGQRQVDPAEAERLDAAFDLAALWLDEVVDVTSLPGTPELMTRRSWAAATMPIWSQLAEPVALSIADSLTRVMSQQAPEELRSMVQGASRMMRGIGGAMFAMQLGQVVGQLATEVVSGGDVGIPLLEDGRAALLPQNVAEFGEGLDLPGDQIELYLAVRELAHARLFRHARWLRLHFITAITAFARGIDVDVERLEELAEGFDPSNTDELRDAVANGALLRPKSAEQEAALGRLETMLALVEGWVDVVTADATSRLPKSDAVAETIRRRRATGGPAESALATLVGLELRPRRLRDAAAMWRAVTDAVGVAARDALWAHPDLLPTAADLDDPAPLAARLKAGGQAAGEADAEFDEALEALLRGETPGAAPSDGSEEEPDAGSGDEHGGDEPGETPGEEPGRG
ncbi:zinc-dependent metalloprotease [Agromyces aurantiacus]|uniref:Zinc-dependent metalloprotease n=1 Tax=Agromyces aurantiacus TaxID=165814 RepID=A0ABV9R8V6_9MICO|nr:zinc-dependent metalloprotease [Agromyces aurantiacus]